MSRREPSSSHRSNPTTGNISAKTPAISHLVLKHTRRRRKINRSSPRRSGLLLTCAALLVAASARAQEADPGAVVSPRANAAAFVRVGPGRMLATAKSRRRRLGGVEFNARNNTSWPAPTIDGITVLGLQEATQHQVLAPFETTLGWVRFSPDGSYLSYAVIRDTGVEQWVLDVASGIPRPLTSASLNATRGEPCNWLNDSSGMLCKFLRSARGSPPADSGGPLDDATQKALFEYYFTSQLATVKLATGRRTDIGPPGIVIHASATPSGQYVVVKLKGPFTPTTSSLSAGQSIEIWNDEGDVVRELAVPEP